MVERQPSKLNVAGSNPVSRSRTSLDKWGLFFCKNSGICFYFGFSKISSMIKSTLNLLEYLNQDSANQHWEIISAYANVIEEKGGPEDGEAVGEYLLEHQDIISLSALYDVVLKWGSVELAQKFFQRAVSEGKFKEGYDLEVLEVFGRFQLEKARPLLVEHALGEPDYYKNLHAVRGLLNYNCDDLQDRIREAIESVYNKGLFNELLPALVCKLHDRAEVLERLYETGRQYCSTDCNAGIFLGFSLCGEQGLPYFKKAMFEPFWEAHYPPRRYVVEGMENLNITFSELFREIQNFQDEEEQRYGLLVLTSLLEVKINQGKMKTDPLESYSDLMRELFTLSGGNYSGDLAEFAAKFGERESVYTLEELLRLRLREEVFFRSI